jgi:hypothetical protein
LESVERHPVVLISLDTRSENSISFGSSRNRMVEWTLNKKSNRYPYPRYTNAKGFAYLVIRPLSLISCKRIIPRKALQVANAWIMKKKGQRRRSQLM